MTIEVRQMVIKSEIGQSDQDAAKSDDGGDESEAGAKVENLSRTDVRRILECIERLRER
jgi:hypothetical protein